MKEKAGNNSGISIAHVLSGLLAVQRKKSITAACLLIVMSLMWARIFISKSPEDAAAGEGQVIPSEQSTANVSSVQPNFSARLIELPKIEGRNDRLTRDFFVIKGLASQRFTAAGNAAGTVNEKIAKRLESVLILDAIVMGINPQAFINNKLYKAGDKIDISDGNQRYDCVIENISQTEVLIDCVGIKIKLELANQLEVIE